MSAAAAGGPGRAELVELRALRQVSAGGLSIAEGGYVHHGRPVAGELAQALVRLNAAGCLTVGAPGPDGHRPVRITAAGAARAAELGRREG